jgi:hypothetical protein
MCPLPCVSSTRHTSPGPNRRTSVGHLDLDAAGQGHDEEPLGRVVGHDVGRLLEHAAELDVGDRDPAGQRDARRRARRRPLGRLQVHVLEVRLAVVVGPDADVVGFAGHVAPKRDSSSTGSPASVPPMSTPMRYPTSPPHLAHALTRTHPWPRFNQMVRLISGDAGSDGRLAGG